MTPPNSTSWRMQHGLAVRRAAPAPRDGRRVRLGADPCAGLVVLVEEGQESDLLRAARSSRSRVTGVKDMRPLGGTFRRRRA